MLLLPYQKTECLDFSEVLEIRLFKIFMILNKNCGATYMSYTFDKLNKVRYSFRTDSKWAEVYHNEKIRGKPIIESCPLDVVSRQRKNTFILWDLYGHKAQPKTYREIMGMREDVGLAHGLTLSTFFQGHHDALAIATENKRHDLALNVLHKDDGLLLKQNLLECRREILHLFANETTQI